MSSLKFFGRVLCAAFVISLATGTANAEGEKPGVTNPAVEKATGTKPAAAKPSTAKPAVEKDAPEAEQTIAQVLGLRVNVGPTKMKLGTGAEIDVPKGFQFFNAADTVKMMKAFGNVTNGKELGTIQPADESWFVVFEFNDSGYVKDDEKESLDADAILDSLKAGNEAGNEERKKMGVATLNITGWKFPPNYDDATKNLQWCIAAESEGNPVLNYQTRILGRRGVMEATLVCGPEVLDSAVPQYKNLINGFHYTQGNTYGDFRDGDKIATYGLAALVAGGGLAAAAKTGLLAKFFGLFGKLGKGIIVVFIAIGAAIKGLFSKLTGRSKASV
ncbi:MAG: DUF2167 domain-containing protein [Pirellulales bacterium]